MIKELGPLTNFDNFAHVASYLKIKDIGNLSQVCQQYNAWANESAIWNNISEREGVPLVAGGSRDRIADFKILYPVTISGRIIGELFGKVVGKVPPISAYWFDKFAQNLPDPYEIDKLFRDNFVVLVDPSFIERFIDGKTPLDIDETGNLKEVAPDAVIEQTLTIPFSLRNMHVLSKYPLKGREHLPVFNKNSGAEAFEHSTSYPSQIGVRIMRRSILEKTRSENFDRQNALVEGLAPNQGFEVESVRRRALFNAVSILNTGMCPDDRGERLWTYARGSDTVTIDGRVYQLVVGGFVPGAGVRVHDFDIVSVDLGVVPGGSAEVPGPLELGHLAID